MSLEDWSRTDEGDASRAKRLAGSYVAALVLVAGLLAVGIAFGGQIKKQVFEEELEVKFVPPEPVKEAPPPPPPPPPKAPPPPRAASNAPPPLGSKRDAPPTEIPKERPDEGDPDRAVAEGPPGEGDPNGVVGGTGRGGAVAPSPEPPAPPVVLAPVRQVAEVSTAPVPIAKAMPPYPEEARKQGIEALVVVKFVVGEDGAVSEPTIVKGHPLFDELVLAAVRSWTFQPATLEGKAVRMVRMVKIPFRLKHS